MIQVAGEWWGTAAEIADQIGQGVTEAAVRYWASKDGLPRARLRDDNGRPQVRYPLAMAARIELQKRLSGRGRRRADL